MEQAHSLQLRDLLSDEQEKALRRLGVPVRYPAGQTIFWEGQPSHSALLVIDGSLKVTQRTVEGSEVILAIRGRDELMGEEGVLTGEMRSATVTAITDVSGSDISATELLAFVEYQHLWPRMYRAAVRRRRQADDQALLSRLDVRSRLARFLLELAVEVNRTTEDGTVIDARLSQSDFAERIGASRAAVAALLAEFRKAGWVSTTRGRIELHDVRALIRVSTGMAAISE